MAWAPSQTYDEIYRHLMEEKSTNPRFARMEIPNFHTMQHIARRYHLRPEGSREILTRIAKGRKGTRPENDLTPEQRRHLVATGLAYIDTLAWAANIIDNRSIGQYIERIIPRHAARVPFSQTMNGEEMDRAWKKYINSGLRFWIKEGIRDSAPLTSSGKVRRPKRRADDVEMIPAVLTENSMHLDPSTIKRITQKLTPKQKIVFSLLLQGFTITEIANKLGVSYSSVHRMRKAIQKIV